MYNKRTWLNKIDSSFTGNVVAFDGKITWKGEPIRNTFLSISDCNNSIRLHPEDDHLSDFIDKMELLHSEIGKFIDYLKTQKINKQ